MADVRLKETMGNLKELVNKATDKQIEAKDNISNTLQKLQVLTAKEVFELSEQLNEKSKGNWFASLFGKKSNERSNEIKNEATKEFDAKESKDVTSLADKIEKAQGDFAKLDQQSQSVNTKTQAR